MITYTIEENEGIIAVCMTGSNSCADLEKHFATSYQDPRYKTTHATLFEVAEDAGGPIMTELEEVKRLFEMTAQLPDVQKKWALVMASPFKRTMVEYFLKDVQLHLLELRIFTDATTARAWLNDGKA